MFRFHTTYDEESKIWHGVPRIPVFSNKVSAGQVILEILERDPDQIGQISDYNGIKLSNEEIRLKTVRASQNLLKMNLGENDVIGIVGKNSTYLAPVVFAALTVGVPINTLDPTFNKGEIAHMFRLTKPSLVFCDHDNITTVKEALNDLAIQAVLFTIDEKVNGHRYVEELFCETGTEHLFIPPGIDDNTKHTAVILCSSGTTGLSKGVSLSHAAVIDQHYHITQATCRDVMFCFSSLYWMSGFGLLISGTLKGVTRIITIKPFSAELMLRLIEEYKITYLMTPPSQLALLLQHPAIETADLSSVQYYTCGGSVVSPDLCVKMDKFLRNGKVHVGYAMSEVAGLISYNYPQPKLGSVGKLASNYSIRVVDDNGENRGIGDEGELYIMIQHSFLGYYNNEEETKNILDNEGWLHTGDIGRIDEEGFLYIVDRKKDILKYNNYQMSPSEIEGLILTHKGVQDVCVVGIPDIISTDIPTALIIKNNTIPLAEQEIIDLVKENMSDFKQLRGGVFFVDSLPMTPSGKMLRRKIKEMAIQFNNERNNK